MKMCIAEKRKAGRKMRENRKNRENRMGNRMGKNRGAGILAAVTGAFALVCGCAFMFSSLAEAAAEADMGRTERIPTAYNLPLAAQVRSVPEGYSKANYKVVSDELLTDKPAEKDLTQAEAAELGAQFIWEIFGVKLDGATIYMGYNGGSESFPKATWQGDVRYGKTRTPKDDGCSFWIDSVTGERFLAARSRTLSVKVNLGPDAALEKDPSEYMKLAKEFAEKKNLVGGEVKKCVYIGQGYGGNDPSISIDVYGVSGEWASIDFSRYDQAVVGVSLDTYNRISDMMRKLIEQNAIALPEERSETVMENAQQPVSQKRIQRY